MKWHYRFMELAALVGSWSKDPSTQVGAVIVDRNRRVISTGYNGLPVGVEDHRCRLTDRSLKLRMVLHAEENAIMFAKTDLSGMTIYTTRHPCPLCAARIIQSGITTVVWSPDEGFDCRHCDDNCLANEMFEEAGVTLVKLI